MGAAPLEVLRVAARMAADLPGQSRRHVLETAAESVGLSLDRRFLAADLDRLEWELRQYQGTFRPEQRRQLRELREAALQAMEFFAEFRPRLVGDVLFGTADDRSPIALQLFADTPEQVIERLLEREIPFEESERTWHYGDGHSERVSVFAFGAGEHLVVLEVFPAERIRQAPLVPGGGGAKLRRLSRGRLEALLADETG